MSVTTQQIRQGFWRVTKWLIALLIVVYLGWLLGLGPKPYRSSASLVVAAYISDPDPECWAQPTPECLAIMAEQRIYDIYDRYGGIAVRAEYVGMLYARLGKFDDADRVSAWIEENRTWEPLFDDSEQITTPFVGRKVKYLLRSGNWREALALVREFGGADGLSKCDEMSSIALSLAVEGRREQSEEALAFMASSGCSDADDWSLTHNDSGQIRRLTGEGFSSTRRSVDLLLLLHLPREELMGHPDYQAALWEWLSVRYDYWVDWKTPTAFTDYCDVLTSVDPNADMEEGWRRSLLVDLLEARAWTQAKALLDRISSRPKERDQLLDWLDGPTGLGFVGEGANIRFIADNYLTDDERRGIAANVADSAGRRRDKETLEWARSYLSEAEYAAAKDEYERSQHGRIAMMHRMVRIREDIRDDFPKGTKALKALSDEYMWRWYHVPLPDFRLRYYRNFDLQRNIVTVLFGYGEIEDGFKLVRKLSYRPSALTAAAWGLMSRESTSLASCAP